jgi:CheY-like chemotaxis protein
VILLMGLDGSVADSSLENLGAFALLSKPARPSVLFDCLASIASGSRENGIASFYLRKSGGGPALAFDARVLVVEDNAVNQDVASGILKQMGCAVVTAANGRSAVQLFAQETFDLILMDCEMPIMDGFDATRRIRDIERVLRGLPDREFSPSRTPIVALTAHALAEVRERCLEAGMDDFLVKPYDELQIGDMLGRWLTPRTAIMTAPESNSPSREEPSSAAAAMRLDMKAVERIRRIGDDGSSLLGQIISQFAATSAPLLQALRAKSRDSDPQAVWRAAHSLKSSASAIGARRVSQYCEEIEALARDNGILPAEALLAELESEVAAATVDLRALVKAEQGAA